MISNERMYWTLADALAQYFANRDERPYHAYLLECIEAWLYPGEADDSVGVLPAEPLGQV